jgi:hypothetical protein
MRRNLFWLSASNGTFSIGAPCQRLAEAGLLETRHVKTALSTMPVKTDRNDARSCEIGFAGSNYRRVGLARGGRAALSGASLSMAESGSKPEPQDLLTKRLASAAVK